MTATALAFKPRVCPRDGDLNLQRQGNKSRN